MQTWPSEQDAKRVFECCFTVSYMANGEMEPSSPKVASQEVAKTVVDKFCLFPKLPKELRTIIWKQALPKSRIVRVARCAAELSTSEGEENQCVDYSQQRLKISQSTPALFCCSKESREVALKQYQLLYKGRPKMKPFYFNSNRDIMFVESVRALKLLMSGDCKKLNGISEYTHDHVHSLMVGGEFGSLKSLAFQLLEQFKKLDKLKLQNQRAAAQSDMGPTWHNKIRRAMERQNPSASVSFMGWSEMVKEFEDNVSQEEKKNGN